MMHTHAYRVCAPFSVNVYKGDSLREVLPAEKSYFLGHPVCVHRKTQSDRRVNRIIICYVLMCNGMKVLISINVNSLYRQNGGVWRGMNETHSIFVMHCASVSLFSTAWWRAAEQPRDVRRLDAATGRALYNMHMHWYVQGVEALMKALSKQVHSTGLHLPLHSAHPPSHSIQPLMDVFADTAATGTI